MSFHSTQKKVSGRFRKVTERTESLLAIKVRNGPRVTLNELQGGLEVTGVKVSTDTMSRSPCRYDIS